jgi:hypothetical protein
MNTFDFVRICPLTCIACCLGSVGVGKTIRLLFNEDLEIHATSLRDVAVHCPPEPARIFTRNGSYNLVCRNQAAQIKTKSLMFIASILLHAFAIDINAQTALSFVM